MFIRFVVCYFLRRLKHLTSFIFILLIWLNSYFLIYWSSYNFLVLVMKSGSSISFHRRFCLRCNIFYEIFATYFNFSWYVLAFRDWISFWIKIFVFRDPFIIRNWNLLLTTFLTTSSLSFTCILFFNYWARWFRFLCFLLSF